jgi:hypothetical protein
MKVVGEGGWGGRGGVRHAFTTVRQVKIFSQTEKNSAPTIDNRQ